jgi:hypothetical protein
MLPPSPKVMGIGMFSVDELFDEDPKKRLCLIVGPSSRTRGILDLEHLSPQGGHHSDVPDANLHTHQVPIKPQADPPRVEAMARDAEKLNLYPCSWCSLVSIRLARGHWISIFCLAQHYADKHVLSPDPREPVSLTIGIGLFQRPNPSQKLSQLIPETRLSRLSRKAELFLFPTSLRVLLIL